MAVRTLHIGVGGRGVWPMRLFPQHDGVEIAGLCDIRPEATEKARETSGSDAPAFDDWRTALNETACDAVVVITPPQLHYEMCLAAVRADKHVLAEKPYTMDLAQACEVTREAEHHGVVVAVAQQVRYTAPVIGARQAMSGGEAGPARFGLMTKNGWRPGVHHSGEQRHSYAWERGVHDIDTVLAVFGSRPRRVSAHSFNPPWSPYAHGGGQHAILEFENGASCGLSCNFVSRRGGSEFRVDGDGGTLDIGAKALTLQRPDAEEPETLELPEVPAPERAVVDGWLDWLAGGDEPGHGMHENLWVVATIEAAGVASDEGRVVDIPDYLERHLATE